jgi:hypothetical protein
MKIAHSYWAVTCVTTRYELLTEAVLKIQYFYESVFQTGGTRTVVWGLIKTFRNYNFF